MNETKQPMPNEYGEPWKIIDGDVIAAGLIIGSLSSIALDDQDRVIKCVNACAGIPDAALDRLGLGGVKVLIEELETLALADHDQDCPESGFDAEPDTCICWKQHARALLDALKGAE